MQVQYNCNSIIYKLLSFLNLSDHYYHYTIELYLSHLFSVWQGVCFYSDVMTYLTFGVLKCVNFFLSGEGVNNEQWETVYKLQQQTIYRCWGEAIAKTPQTRQIWDPHHHTRFQSRHLSSFLCCLLLTVSILVDRSFMLSRRMAFMAEHDIVYRIRNTSETVSLIDQFTCAMLDPSICSHLQGSFELFCFETQ